MRKNPPDLILLDIMMPGLDGYEVCRQLKEDEQTRDIPVIFLSALHDMADKLKAFTVGGVDYVSKPFQVDEVMARVNTHLTIRLQQKEPAKMYEELKLLADNDPLTGLPNRRHFLEKARHEENRVKRTSRPMAIILLDIDHFKRVNDSHGHECGDIVLKEAAQRLKAPLRDLDIVARWGGEEFICLLPDTLLEGARHTAEKLRVSISELCLEYNSTRITLSITLGAALYDGSTSLDECINQADTALYEGKENGRDQVVTFADAP